MTNLLSPAVMGALLAAALVFFVIGRASMSGARKREEVLKRDLLDAKASVPQLESNIRNRDQQIGRLQEEVSDLNERTTELLHGQDVSGKELRRAEREIKNLTSELNAVRGVRSESDNVLMDGFDDEVAVDPSDSPAVTKLKKLEALYEKLKDALIKRDARIEELEDQIAGGGDSAVVAAMDEPGHDDAFDSIRKPLEDKISEQGSAIEALHEEISELRKEKEMLEDLANRRSKSNRALKDATAEVEARVPTLEKEIAERDETISAREGSIKRLLGDVETAKADIATREQTIATLTADIESNRLALETSQQQQNELQASVSRREERITALDTELATTLGIVKQLQSELDTANTSLTEQQTAVDQINVELQRRDQAEESLKNTIRDRDFRIDALTGEKRALESDLTEARDAVAAAEQAVETVRQEAEDGKALEEKRQQATASEKEVTDRQTAAQQREIEDLKANLKQHEQWMDKLKSSLEDRETRSRDLQETTDGLRVELDQANERLRNRHDERQVLEDAKHELEKEIVTLKSRVEQTQAELAEQAQTLSVYKSMQADKDFQIDSLEQELRSVQAPDDVQAPESNQASLPVPVAMAGDTPEEEPPAHQAAS